MKELQALKEIIAIENLFLKIKDKYIAIYDYETIYLWDTEKQEYRSPLYLEDLFNLLKKNKEVIEIVKEEDLPKDSIKEFHTKLQKLEHYDGDLPIPFNVSSQAPPQDYIIENLFEDFTVTLQRNSCLVLCPALKDHATQILNIFKEYKSIIKDSEYEFLYKNSEQYLTNLINKIT